MNKVLANARVRTIALSVIMGTCFQASAQTAYMPYKISGTVKSGTVALPNLSVTANNGGGQDLTDNNGLFHVYVPAHWTGQITPVATGYTFTPTSYSFSSVTRDMDCPGFTAISTANLPPEIFADTTDIGTPMNTAVSFDLGADDGDAAPESLKWWVSTAPRFGTAMIESCSPSTSGDTVSIQYMPVFNFSGNDFFSVSVSDAAGAIDTIVVNVSVQALQPLPAAATGIGARKAPTEDVQALQPLQAAATGSTYYVAANGSDSASGTSAAPFRTIQKGANVAVAGSTVIIRGGTYTSGSTSASVPVLSISLSKKGTATAPITIKAAPGETVVLDGRGVSTSLVNIRGSYINLEGLQLKNAKRTAVAVLDDDQNGTVGAHHVNVRLCYAHHNNYDASFIGGAFRTVGPCEYVVFEDCMAHDNSIGFEFREFPTQTAGRMSVPPIAGNIGYTTNLPESQWNSWPGWVGYAARYCTIRRCIAYDNRLNDENSDGFECRYAIECTIEENVSFGNGDDNYDMAGATRCTIRRNIGFNANPLNTVNGDGNGLKIGVRGGLDNLAHNNILFNNPRAGLDMADTERARVYNNTCYNNAWRGIWFESTRAKTGGATVLNNICRRNTNGDMGRVSSSRMIRSDYNCVSDANSSGSSFSVGSHGFVSTNPLFTNEALGVNTTFPSNSTIPQKLAYIRNQVNAKLSLASGSKCVNSAEFISGITGPVLGTGPDRGAIESR